MTPLLTLKNSNHAKVHRKSVLQLGRSTYYVSLIFFITIVQYVVHNKTSGYQWRIMRYIMSIQLPRQNIRVELLVLRALKPRVEIVGWKRVFINWACHTWADVIRVVSTCNLYTTWFYRPTTSREHISFFMTRATQRRIQRTALKIYSIGRCNVGLQFMMRHDVADDARIFF